MKMTQRTQKDIVKDILNGIISEDELRLNSRQWALYGQLKKFFEENPNRVISNREMCETLYSYYPFNHNTENFNNTKARRMLTEDYKILNLSSVIQWIIIHPGGGAKLAASKEEVESATRRRKASLARSMKIQSILQRKLRTHNQMIMPSKKSKQIFQAYIQKGA